MNKGKVFLGIGLLAFLGLIVWAVTTVPDPPPPVIDEEKPLVMSYEGNTLSEEKNGVTIWDMTADSIIVDADSQNVTLKNIKAHFYAQDGRVVEAVAAQGKYENESKDIALEGDVKITTSDGAELTSKQLIWTAKEQLLAAVGEANVSKDDMKASGDRIESSDGFQIIRIKGKAHLVKGVQP